MLQVLCRPVSSDELLDNENESESILAASSSSAQPTRMDTIKEIINLVPARTELSSSSAKSLTVTESSSSTKTTEKKDDPKVEKSVTKNQEDTELEEAFKEEVNKIIQQKIQQSYSTMQKWMNPFSGQIQMNNMI